MGGSGSTGSLVVDTALRAPISWREFLCYDTAHPAAESALRDTPYTSWSLARAAPSTGDASGSSSRSSMELWRSAVRADNLMLVFAVAAAAYILQGLVAAAD